MRKIKLAFYYLIIQRLPHSNVIGFMNKIRVWYVCKVLKIMQKSPTSIFQHNVYIGDGTKLKIGTNCQINEHVYIQGANIGNDVMIAPNVTIISHRHIIDRTDIPMNMQGHESNLIVTIEDDVWIGRNVVIMPGITIHKGSVVAAGSIVTKDVPPYCIVGGVPAKKIKDRK